MTLISDSDLGEDWSPTEEGEWTYTAEMEYGAKIVAGNTEYTVTNTETEFRINLADVPEMSGREGWWKQNPEITEKGVTLTAEYEGDTINYKSVVAFTAEGMEENTEHSVTFGSSYTLVTPEAAGHTFLGWYQHVGDTWKKVETLELNESGKTTVEVEALWASTDYSFTMSGSRSGRVFSSYTNTVTIQETEEVLVGAFAGENMTRSVTREVYIGTGEPVYTEKDGTEFSENMGRTGSGVKAYVRVTVTYTDENGNVLLTIVVEHNGSYSALSGGFTQQA